MRQPIDLIGGFYTDDSLPWSCQDTVNYIPVAAEVAGTRTPAKLVDAPGLRPWVAIGNTDGDPSAGAPIRGLHDVEGRLFVVSGRMLYEISQKGVAIPRGTIPGVGRVSMAHNQRGHGHELLVVNGSGGYVYNTGSDTFSVVTDAGYPGAAVVDFLDGYLMQVEPFGRFLFHSDLADALEYNTLDRFEAETQPDRVVGMIVNHQEVWAFGDRTIDVFGNAGTAQGTFQNKGVSISRGCIAKWSPAIVDNGVAWLGDDRVVYHARGYDPVRISTRAIEVALSECSLTDIRNAFSFVWSDRGHSVYYLTVPNGQTFGYDFSTGLWHRRASWHPERDIGGRWRLADLVRHNGRWIGGDFRDGRLYQLDWDYMLEGCEPLIRERVSPVIHGDGRRFATDSVELVYDSGGEASSCDSFFLQPEGPRLSGAAPDGSIIEVYPGYTYSVTPGDSPIAKVELVGGSLPGGLAFDSGAWSITSGFPEDGGRFPLTIRATDTNGLWAEIRDEIEISPIVYVVFSSAEEGLWASADLSNWSGLLELVPSVGDGVYNAIVSGGSIVADVLGDGPSVEVLATLKAPPWPGFIEVLGSSQVEASPSLVGSRMMASGEVVIVWEKNANHPHYWLSDDAGATWEKVEAPGGRRCGGISQMGSGRWIAHFGLSSSNHMFYSDDEVPRTWTQSDMSVSRPSTSCVTSDGSFGYVVNNSRTVYRTQDGATWTQISPSSAFSRPNSAQLFTCSNGNLIAHGTNSDGRVAVSTDKGVNWTEVVFNSSGDITTITEAGGILLGSSNHSNFYTSTDFGLTWEKRDPPFSGYLNQATIVAMDFSK